MKKPVLMIAPSFDDAGIQAVCAAFSECLGKPLDFDIIKDEKLIGGFIAMIDGKVYDTSFTSQLNEIQRQMNQ
jgi:F0F1-type ATP synthase delta subunit